MGHCWKCSKGPEGLSILYIPKCGVLYAICCSCWDANQSKSLISKYCMYISINVILPPTDHLISYETMQEMPRRHVLC